MIPIEKILKEKGIWYRLISLDQSAYTVADVMQYSKGDIASEEICKTIILSGTKTRNKIGILLRGNDKIDFTKIKNICGEGMAIANEMEIREAAGVDRGAVCPFLLHVPLYVDTHVLLLNKINCGSGDHLFGLEFEIKDLEKGIEYIKIDATK